MDSSVIPVNNQGDAREQARALFQLPWFRFHPELTRTLNNFRGEKMARAACLV